MLVNFVSVSRVRESRTHGLIRGGCRKAVAYFLRKEFRMIRLNPSRLYESFQNSLIVHLIRIFHESLCLQKRRI